MSIERVGKLESCVWKSRLFLDLRLLQIPNRIFPIAEEKKKSARIFSLQTLDLTVKKAVARGGTRIPCEIPVILSSDDAQDPFSESCYVILANLRGCAARSPRPVPTGTAVHLHGLPSGSQISARVINCISLGEFEKIWLLGLALDESGNVWGIESVPDDWREQA